MQFKRTIMPKTLCAVFAAATLFTASACSTVPVPFSKSHKHTNASFFQDKDDFLRKVSSLEKGMTLDQMANALGLDSERTAIGDWSPLRRLDTPEEINAALYGVQQFILDDVDDLDDLGRHYEHIDVFVLSYRDITKQLGISLTDLETEQNGYEYSVIIAFENGKMMKKPKPGDGVVDDQDSKSHLRGIIKAVPGAVLP